MPLGRTDELGRQVSESARSASARDEFVLDMTRPFLPEALASLAAPRLIPEVERTTLNQIQAGSYVHLFEVIETSLAEVAKQRALADVDTREALEPLLLAGALDHAEVLRAFRSLFVRSFVVVPRFLPLPRDLRDALEAASPLSLLVFSLHFKLVTQQHYLACVRGDDNLEPRFVRLLRDHWRLDCGETNGCRSSFELSQALTRAPAGRIPSALRDYKTLVFTCDDVLSRQAELDVASLELAERRTIPSAERVPLVKGQAAAHRKTFLTVGIVNAAFVYAMRSLGPAAPATLAGIVSGLAAR